MLRPVEFADFTPETMGGFENYRRACEVAGLDPSPEGYGLLYCRDDDGNRFTCVTTDLPYFRAMLAMLPAERARLQNVAEKFPITRAGWPDEWLRGTPDEN
jgi:hypothetical protein